MISSLEQKVLVVVRALPLESSGTPVVIRSLLSHLPSDNFFVLGRTPHPDKLLPNILSHKMVEIPILYTKGHRFWKYYSILPGIILGLWMIRKYKINKIVGVFQDDASLILAFVLALFMRKTKFYPYLMDLYAEQGRDFKLRIASFMQRLMFKRATRVLVVNDGLKNYLCKLYPNVSFVTIPIICQTKPVYDAFNKSYSNSKLFVIVFSGSVNDDRLETLRILSGIVAKDNRFTIKYLTSQSEQKLRDLGVFFDGFERKFCSSTDELMTELNNADLLYLPLSFSFPKSKEVQMMTCFGAKVYDYMSASVPILIHAPSYVYNYTFFEDNKAAFLLSSINDDEIKECLDYLFLEARSLIGTTKVKNANLLADKFQGETVVKKFNEFLTID